MMASRGMLLDDWDYLLGLEGALLFATSSIKKLEDHSAGSLAYPFCVRAVGAGYGSASLPCRSYRATG